MEVASDGGERGDITGVTSNLLRDMLKLPMRLAEQSELLGSRILYICFTCSVEEQ